MKKLLVLCILVLSSMSVYAQKFEVKSSPLFLLFENVNLDLEYILGDHSGVELRASTGGLSAESQKYKVSLAYKHYFGEDLPASQFNIFSYLYMKETYAKKVGLGFGFGYKWVRQNNFVFELGVGAGRDFYSDYENNFLFEDLFIFDFYGKMAVGYRF